MPILVEKNILDEKNSLNFKSWDLNDNIFSNSSFKDASQANNWVENVKTKGKLLPSIEFLNELEAYAMYFTNGVADEAVAFPVNGHSFCEWINAFAPLLFKLRDNSVTGLISGPYPNIVKLFDIWQSRLAKDKMQAEFSSLNLRMAAIKDKEIKPIGT